MSKISLAIVGPQGLSEWIKAEHVEWNEQGLTHLYNGTRDADDYEFVAIIPAGLVVRVKDPI